MIIYTAFFVFNLHALSPDCFYEIVFCEHCTFCSCCKEYDIMINLNMVHRIVPQLFSQCVDGI